MTFGQTSGPPATAAQLAELAELFAAAGFDSFHEARHPYDLSQRQSNGKFTRTEADELIDRLQAEAEGTEPPDDVPPQATAAATPPGRIPRTPKPRDPDPVEPGPGDVVLAFPDEMLADELRRRGWTCTPPD